MPMKRESGKDRWRRIPKDYFKSRDRLQSVKLGFSAVALVLAVAWWASGVDWKSGLKSSTDLNSLRTNHGELNRVHAAWAEKCDACHIPFESITSRSSDKLCMSCHAGPAHHATMIDTEVQSCASCHRDHQGANFSLVRLKEGDCTSCHANLNAHVAFDKKPAGQRKYAENIARFALGSGNHPPFRPEAASFENENHPVDKSKLKFNHARHMMPGIVEKPGDVAYKIKNIPLVEEWARYRKTDDPDEAVQLDCASCHVLDANEQKHPANPSVLSTPLPARSSGRYYLPATFETSCRACHVTTIVEGARPIEVPHGIQTDQVKEFLEATLASRAFSEDPKALASFVPPVRIPGKSPVESTVIAKRNDAVRLALKSLYAPSESKSVAAKAVPGDVRNQQNCLECHYYGPVDGEGFPTKIEATKVPEIWFTHAAFDHTAHRGVSCRDCHAKAYAYDLEGKSLVEGASIVGTDYLNPGIDNCVQCHAPAKSGGTWMGLGTATKPTGGASYDCTECHRYHNGDHTLQGYGASAEESTAVRTISQYISGTAGEPVKPERAKSKKP